MTTVSLARDESRIDFALLARTSLLVALLDGIFAMAFYSVLRRRVITGAIWRSVASNVLGPSALQGGASATMLGVTIHIAVATGWTLLFFAVLRVLPAVADIVRTRGSAIATGAIYGMLIWLSMQYVVVPLGRGKPASPASFNFWAMFVWHAIGVGPPIALMLRRVATDR